MMWWLGTIALFVTIAIIGPWSLLFIGLVAAKILFFLVAALVLIKFARGELKL